MLIMKKLLNKLDRFCNWMVGIGWTDLGVVFCLCAVSDLSAGQGQFLKSLTCWILALIVFVRAPRKVSNE